MAKEPRPFEGPWSMPHRPFAAPQRAPPMRRRIIVTLIALVVAGILLELPGYLQQWLWMQQLNYTGIFWTLISVQYAMFSVAFVFAFLFLWINIRQAIRANTTPRWIAPRPATPPPWGGESLEQPDIHIITRHLHFLNVAISTILALVFAFSFSAQWDIYLRFRYGGSYGIPDPLLGIDVGFYLFHLPFYQLEQGTLAYLISVALILVIAFYSFSGALRFGPNRRVEGSDAAIRHAAVLLAALAAVLGWGFYLDRFNLVYSTLGVVYGAGYAADHVTRVALRVMIVLSGAACVLFALTLLRPRITALVTVLSTYVAIYVVGILLLPSIVQKYIVQPNELQLEAPYLRNHIAFTRKAYQLDTIQETSYPALPDLTPGDVAKNQDTISNIPLWDERPLLQTYHQTQAIRLYYQFYNVDTDRYHLKDGYHQVMLSARELSADLPAQARTWVNQHLQFTHGYGTVMSFASETEQDGVPKYILENIPPQSDYGLRITQPSIYFGESMAGYRIVGTDIKEFDYPKGNQDVYTRYDGHGGILLDTFWKRLLFAWTQHDINIILTSYLNPESRIQIWRRVHERVSKIAPFLRFDNDPYPVVSDGKLYWIQDAYTISSYFPYSEPARTILKTSALEPGPSSPTSPFGEQPLADGAGFQASRQTAVPVGFSDRLNYIRNSVKIVVDMYDGSVRFYVMDPDDPILSAYRRAFPGVFQDLGQLSEDLKHHLRYPEDLFGIQADLYRTFHMTDPQVFYNREDLWEFPMEKYEGQPQPMRPYYVMIRLPGSNTLEFLLMTPFTPQSRDNMISWIAAKSDFPNYGQIVFYELPKEKLIYGPNQVEAMIDQNTTISQQLTLWDQRGSRVIRGKQIVTPIDNSFLYVVPVYLTATGTKFPQLKRVIVAANNRVAMAPTLETALADLFALAPPEAAQSPSSAAQTSGSSSARVEEPALAHARADFEEAKKALHDSDWQRFGQAMDSLERQLSSPPVGH